MPVNVQWFRRGGLRSTRLVMIGASAGAFLLLVLSTFTSWPVGGGGGGGGGTGTRGDRGVTAAAVNPAFEANAGDCLNWTRPDLSDVARVDCGSQHLFEVTGTVDITSTYGKDARFPDNEVWQTISADHCTETSLTYLNEKFDPFGKYSVGTLNPGERRWGEGYRTLRCGLQVAAASGALLPSYGTAKTQDQSLVYDAGVCLGINGNSVGDPIECAQPHTFEIIGVADLGTLVGPDFPDPARQDDVLAEECSTMAAEYTGGADLRGDKLAVSWDTRVSESWAAGSRRANCKIGAIPEGNTLVAWTGSVRNPDAPPLTTSNPPQTTTVAPQAEPTGAPLHSEGQQPSTTGQPSAPPSGQSSVAPTSSTVTRTEEQEG
ncbi:septum formation family protein [Umezawaea beigongshangensis]|uniref:septum formation family protein n=1 Tax=Umezawaea beigongshangensis TaxID=2780383 RepID=UPI001E524260|nr:septum formation family protein [Umezawaea beigongshangensis]